MQAHVKKSAFHRILKFKFGELWPTDEDVWPIEGWYVTTDLSAELNQHNLFS